MTLLVTPVLELCSPEQRFLCRPYSVVVSARVCLLRQAQHGQRVAISASGSVQLWRVGAHATRIHDYGRCRDCELGRAVRAAVEVPADDA